MVQSEIRRRYAGFTLIELMVTFAVVALLLAAIPGVYVRFADSLEYRSAVRNMLATLKSARNQSVSSGLPVSFVLNPVDRVYSVGDAPSMKIPGQLSVRIIAAANATGGESARIVFYPDGSSSGGSVDLARSGGQGVRLRVDWLLGRVTQERLVLHD